MNTDSLQNETRTSSGTQSALAPGFDMPVLDAQSCFRTIMNAMARPGIAQVFERAPLDVPAPLTPLGAAIALTLFDYDTPIWLDETLAQNPDVLAYLRFHTGAPIVDDRQKAAFALCADVVQLPDLAGFAQGSAEYPDTSTTVILLGQSFGSGTSLELTGPGIKKTQTFSTNPVPSNLWVQMQDNARRFPCGVDLLFASDTEIAGLPRSTKIKIVEA